MKNLFKLGLVALMSVCALGFVRAEEEAGDPETLTVTPAGKYTVGANDSVLFDSIATFKMKVEGKTTNDTNYKIVVKYFVGEDPIGTELGAGYTVADTVVELVAVYNGDYAVTFELQRRNEGARVGDWSTIGEAKTFYIRVTNYAEPAPLDINFSVKAAKNTTQDEKIVFANGNVTFDIFVKGEDVDTNYWVEVLILNRAQLSGGQEDPQPSRIRVVADSIRYIDGAFFNDEYEAWFDLYVWNERMEEFLSVDNMETIKIPFLVTENAAPAPDPSIKVEPVDATKDGDNYVFAPGKVAFDILLQNMEELDTNYYFAMAVCTKAQYEDTNYKEEWKIEEIAQKVHYAPELNEKGEYAAMFELRAPDKSNGRDEEAEETEEKVAVVSSDIIFFTIGTVANENVELAGVNVYPNPNAGAFNVAVPERALVEIYGLNGAKVMSREVNAGVEAFNLDNSGIYFVRVMAGNKTAVKRVVVR